MMNNLPDYMKLFFLALYNTTNEMTYDCLKEQGENILPYLRKAVYILALQNTNPDTYISIQVLILTSIYLYFSGLFYAKSSYKKQNGFLRNAHRPLRSI